MPSARLLLISLLALTGCDGGPTDVDGGTEGGPDASVTRDGAPADPDAGEPPDGGPPPLDAGTDGGTPGVDCAPQQAYAEGDCGRSFGFVWDGYACVERVGCGCAGRDCLTLAPDMASCEAVHASCAPASPDCVPSPDAGGGGPGCAAEVRYVTPDGSASADGRTASSAWSLEHALATAGPGTVVFIRGGDYGDLRLRQSTDGRADAPIRFIGTDPSWALPAPGARASVSGTEPVDPGVMPLLRGVLTGNRGSGTALQFDGDHVHVENVQVSRYSIGFDFRGSHQVMRNLVSDHHGDFSGRPYEGWGMFVRGDHARVERCFIRDGAAEGISIRGSDGVYRDIEVVGIDGDNPMDYYFLLNGHRNRAERIVVYRSPGLSHLGHGICIKPVGATSTQNVVDGFRVVNTNVELQFAGCSENVIRNGVITRTTEPEWSTALTIANGAHHNLFQNMIVSGSYAGVVFNDWDDGAADESGGDAVDAGHDNDLVNLVVRDASYGIFMRDQGSAGVARRNRFIHASFLDVGELFRIRRGNEGTELHHCVIDGAGGFAREELGFRVASDTAFVGCNVSASGFDGFTGYAESGTTRSTPAFVAPGDPRPADDALDGAEDASALHPEAARDLYGRERTAPITRGAVEYVPE